MTATPSLLTVLLSVFIRNVATPSRPSPILRGCVAPPSTSSWGGVVSESVTDASAPEPITLLATPTLTSNSSPGVTAVGAFGDSTKSPRTVERALATPIDRSVTVTAKTRSEPLK